MISDQIKLIRKGLAKWARANGNGQAKVAGDPNDIVFQLASNPGAIQALVMFHSELKRGEYEESGMVDRTFWIVVSRGRGMKLEPGASLVDGASGGPPMFDLVEGVRETCRGLTFDEETEGSINYKGVEPFVMEGYLTDAYKIEFSIGVQLPAAEPQNEDEAD